MFENSAAWDQLSYYMGIGIPVIFKSFHMNRKILNCSAVLIFRENSLVLGERGPTVEYTTGMGKSAVNSLAVPLHSISVTPRKLCLAPTGFLGDGIVPFSMRHWYGGLLSFLISIRTENLEALAWGAPTGGEKWKFPSLGSPHRGEKWKLFGS